MEALIHQFQQVGFEAAAGSHTYYPSHDTTISFKFEFALSSKGVYAKQSFNKGDCLGELTGIFRTIYEVPHNHYLCFTDDTVLDYGVDLYRFATANPLWFMNENEDTQEMPNVALNRDAEGRCWALASQRIWPGDELVYNIADSTDEKESWYCDAHGENDADADAESTSCGDCDDDAEEMDVE
jgi:hypothetical protein